MGANARAASILQLAYLPPMTSRDCTSFNGKTHGKAAPLFRQAGYRTVVLPSTSSAHAVMTFEGQLRCGGN